MPADDAEGDLPDVAEKRHAKIDRGAEKKATEATHREEEARAERKEDNKGGKPSKEDKLMEMMLQKLNTIEKGSAKYNEVEAKIEARLALEYYTF